MNSRNAARILFPFLGLMALILDGRTSLQGAAEGIELCIRTVIPSLFPFLFLCGMVTNSLWGGNLSFLRPAGYLLDLPKGAESLLISGFLGGYPTGAQAIGEVHRSGRLTRDDAHHLLTCCCNAGPAFLFGMVGAQFSDTKMVWALWMIQILSALFTGLLFRKGSSQSCNLTPRPSSVSSILGQTVQIMALICGWILLFRILFAFLQQWILWIFPPEIQVLISGFLELSNGCCALSSIENEGLRFLICSTMLSFGGICVAMQTSSVIGDLSLTSYLWGKTLQTLLSVILSFSCWQLGGWILWFFAGMLAVFPKIQKRSRFPAGAGV